MRAGCEVDGQGQLGQQAQGVLQRVRVARVAELLRQPGQGHLAALAGVKEVGDGFGIHAGVVLGLGHQVALERFQVLSLGLHRILEVHGVELGHARQVAVLGCGQR